MSQDKQLIHLARAIFIALTPFDKSLNDTPSLDELRRKAMSKEYWNALGGVNQLCEDFHREWGTYEKYGYQFPPKLDYLFSLIGTQQDFDDQFFDALDILREIANDPLTKESLIRICEPPQDQQKP